MHHRSKALAVLRELVNGRGSGRGQASTANHAAELELLQACCKDVRSASVEAGVKIRVAELTMLKELTDDEERPALADEIERTGDRAVLVVALRHGGRILALELANWKHRLANRK
jgi:hypothetical protein